MKQTKSKKPIFSDRIIVAMMELDQTTLKKVLGNMNIVLKAAAKNNIRIVPCDSDRDLDLNELEEKEPNTKDRKLQMDIMFQ